MRAEEPFLIRRADFIFALKTFAASILALVVALVTSVMVEHYPGMPFSFCNNIGTFETCRQALRMSACWGRPDGTGRRGLGRVKTRRRANCGEKHSF
jgi:hypothetical protein